MATLATATEEVVAPAVCAVCREVERLRAEVKQLHGKLRVSRQHARSHERQDRREGGRGDRANDFEQFLQRKILKNSLRIARHIAEHRCEELGKER